MRYMLDAADTKRKNFKKGGLQPHEALIKKPLATSSKNQLKIERNVNGKITRMRGLSQTSHYKYATKRGSQSRAEIRFGLLHSRPYGLKMVAFNLKGERGQKTEASEQNFSGLKLLLCLNLRSLAWLLIDGTNWKQIKMNALNSLRALSCQINKPSLETAVIAPSPK